LARPEVSVARSERLEPAQGRQTGLLGRALYCIEPPFADGYDRCSPKAKVTSSNLVGRANQINELRRLFRRRAKGKLTTNSPTERAYWRVIGGDFVILLP